MREASRCRVVGGVDYGVGDDSNIAPDTRKDKNAHMMRKNSVLFGKRKERAKVHARNIHK